MTEYKRMPYEICPICGSTKINALMHFDCRTHPMWRMELPANIYWLKCASCKHIFTDGYFEGDALSCLLFNAQANQQVGVDENQRMIWADLIEKVQAPRETFALPSPSWLDVGFGSGGLLMTAREFGYDVVGLDLRKDNVDAIQKLGYDAHCGTIESLLDLVPMESYNIISMMDVLEHMPFPHTALEAAHKLLKPDGALIVSCPNMDTEVWRALDKHNQNPYWLEIEHYHNFTRKSLDSLLDSLGFASVSYHVSKRYRACMEIIAMKKDSQ